MHRDTAHTQANTGGSSITVCTCCLRAALQQLTAAQASCLCSQAPCSNDLVTQTVTGPTVTRLQQGACTRDPQPEPSTQDRTIPLCPPCRLASAAEQRAVLLKLHFQPGKTVWQPIHRGTKAPDTTPAHMQMCAVRQPQQHRQGYSIRHTHQWCVSTCVR
jgi:hypothetical protein